MKKIAIIVGIVAGLLISGLVAMIYFGSEALPETKTKPKSKPDPEAEAEEIIDTTHKDVTDEANAPA